MILFAGSGFIDFHVTMHTVTMISMKCELAHCTITKLHSEVLIHRLPVFKPYRWLVKFYEPCIEQVINWRTETRHIISHGVKC